MLPIGTFLLFPGLPLVEYARQHGYVDPDFDIDRQVAESQDVTLKTSYAKEFRNIASLFWVMVKFTPRWMPFFRWLVGLPDNVIFRAIGSFNLVQELLFYRVSPIPALRYFRNTVLVTSRSGLSMTMRTIPSVFKRRGKAKAAADGAEPAQVGQREVFESSRGYF